MIYVIYGSEPYLINNQLNEIINSHKDAFITRFNGLDSDFSVNTMLDACQSVGLFSDSSLVIVKDPYFLINKVDDKTIESINNYVLSQSYENTLVLYTLDNSFNTRSKLFKDILTNAQGIELNKLRKYDFYNYARGLIKNRISNISKDAIELLVKNSNYDISLLSCNLDVLELYPDYIDLDVVNNLISMPNEDDVFSLINALTNKKVSLSIKYANKLLENNEPVLRLLSTIASQLRFIYEISYLESIHKSFQEICKMTNSKDYRVQKALESLQMMNENDILKLQSKIADLDYKLKMNNEISEKLNLELLIVSLMG